MIPAAWIDGLTSAIALTLLFAVFDCFVERHDYLHLHPVHDGSEAL